MHKKLIGVLVKALIFAGIVLAAYSILVMIGWVAGNVEYLYIVLIGLGAYVIRETLGMFKSLRRWL